MNSYSVVIAPIAALLAVDYFFVKKRKVNIYEMYKPNGIYYFTQGWNWRAYAATVIAVAPNLPGISTCSRLLRVNRLFRELT